MSKAAALRYDARQEEDLKDSSALKSLVASVDGKVNLFGDANRASKLDIDFLIRSEADFDDSVQIGEFKNDVKESTTGTRSRFGGKVDNVRISSLQSVYQVPSSPPPLERFDLLNQWEGVVQEVDEKSGYFLAELSDMTDPLAADEEMEFPISDVAESDREFLVPGAIFRWSIGYRHSLGGQFERVSRLRFARIPGWRRQEVEDIKRAADEAYRTYVEQQC